ncbi:unnamed protein product [Discula destructiva]
MKTATTNPQHESASVIAITPPPNTQHSKRPVQIGYRPVGGRAAVWTVGVLHEILKRVGNMGIRLNDPGPNPHHHWCVVVGEYYHHAQIVEHGRVRYANGKISWKDGWSLFNVGETTLNDAAIVDAARSLLVEIPEVYDIWENNCHHFVIKLIDKICPPGYKEISTARRFHRRSTSINFEAEYKEEVARASQ